MTGAACEEGNAYPSSVSSGSEKVLAKPLAKLKYLWPNLKSIGQI